MRPKGQLLTVHVHLSLQSILVDDMIWPFSDVGSGFNIRTEIQGALKAKYVDPIIELARMTSRAPIVNINHDLRFVGAGNRVLQKRPENFHGCHAMGAYIALELRVRGCVVVHGSSFWSKMACHMRLSATGVHLLSVDAHGDGDTHCKHLRAVCAIYEKKLFSEKMVAACFMDHNKIREWDENIKARTINRQDFVEIWKGTGGVDVSTTVSVENWVNAESRQRIQSGAQGDSIQLSMPPRFGKISTLQSPSQRPVTTIGAIGSKWTRILQAMPLSRKGKPTSVKVNVMKNKETFEQANFLRTGNGYPQLCIGCAHTAALRLQSHVIDNWWNGSSMHWPALC